MQSFPIFFLWITRRLYYRGSPTETSELHWGAQFARGNQWARWRFLLAHVYRPRAFHRRTRTAEWSCPTATPFPALVPTFGLPMPTRLDFRFDKTRCGSRVDRALVACVQFYRCCYPIYLCLLLITRKAFASTRLASIFTINPPAHRLLVLCTQTTERDIEP